MPHVTFRPSGLTLDVPAGSDLLDALREVGLRVETPCGCAGTCGKCLVRIVAGDVDSDSLGLLDQAEVADGYVLACRTRLLSGPVTVEVPEPVGREAGQFGDSAEDRFLIRHELLPQKWEFDPLAVKWLLEVPPPQIEGGLSDLDRFVRAIQRQWGPEDVICPLPVIRNLADALRAANGTVTATLIREGGRINVVGVEAGDQTVRHYGIAVDIGTTTVAVQLVYLPLARIVATRSEYNDQVACGLDVISRINYARDPERLDELRERVLGTINQLIRLVCSTHGVRSAEVSNAVISGNTTMTHLLLGLKPEYIRLEPYTPTIMRGLYLPALKVGLEINPQSWVYISPAVGSYVGGDITAGLLCTDLATESEQVNLFIDIGTNGEIVIGNRDFLMTCACSAGPAFEGGGIDCGMRAALGAIERVDVDAASGRVRCSTIGGGKPKGICGSGMISLLADLLLTGWIDAAGKFSRTRPNPAIRVAGRVASYVIVPAAESGTGQDLAISEVDIDNIIRAKASIYSACAMMLKQVGMDFHDLAHVYIAGGFGRYLDIEKAIVLGLVPDLPRSTFQYIGNASLMGSYMVLVSQDFRERQQVLADRMTYLELNTDPAYMDQYTAALFLPHTDAARFPSVQKSLARRT